MTFLRASCVYIYAAGVMTREKLLYLYGAYYTLARLL